MAGGGGGGGGYGGETPDNIDCDDIGGECVLSSPDADVIKALKVGQCLAVELRTVQGVKVAVALHKGEQAGVIPSAQFKRLLVCLNQGRKFHAVVKGVSGGMCTVDLGSGKCP